MTLTKAGLFACAVVALMFGGTVMSAPPATSTTVDADGDTGQESSMVLDAAGNPVIAYYDATNRDLRLVHCDDPACAGMETPVTVDAAGDVGHSPSLALDAEGNPVIAYIENTSAETTAGPLRLVHCDDPSCAGVETPVTVDPDTSTRPSLVLDASGNPVIAYSYGGLKLVHCDDPACAGVETPVTVDPQGREAPSLALDASGNPVIAYGVDPFAQIGLIHCDDPNCVGVETATATLTDGDSNAVSMELDADGNPVLTYIHTLDDALKLVHCDDPDCAGVETKRTIVGANARAGTSLVLDASGIPFVSYIDFDFLSGTRSLRLVRCTDPGCTDAETPVIVDGNPGFTSSSALDTEGRPVISYYQSANGDLGLARCVEPGCVDLTGPTPTIGLGVGQSATTHETPVVFEVVFDEPVASFTAADVTVTGTAGATAATVSGDGPSYTVTIATVPDRGTVAIDVAAGAVTDLAGNESQTSVLAGNTVTVELPADAVTTLSPQRFADTRAVGETIDDRFERAGRRVAQSEYEIQIAGRGDVPMGAQAVVANVTAVAAENTGFVTAHPCLSAPPNASSLNFTAGVNIANEVIIPLAGTGEICLFTSASTHLLVDVVGYIDAASPTTPVTPARYLDTRSTGETFDDENEAGGKTAARTQITLPIAGRGDVPLDAGSVVINVTAIAAETDGFFTVHPCLATPPNAARLNYAAGLNRANEIVAQLDSDGNICVFTSATAHIAADVVGYLPVGTDLSNVTPSRLVDTRSAGETIDGAYEAEGQQAEDTEVRIQIDGRPGIPRDATSAVLYIAAVNPVGSGFITTHPCSDPRPNASSVNYVANTNSGNEVITRLDATGGICIYTSTTTHITVDAVAYQT